MAVDVLPPKRDVGNNNNLRHDPVKASTGDDNSKWLNPYEKLTRDLVEDERCVKEFSLGKRIGFYRLRGDLGSGNFAKVKLGFHCLAKEKVAVKILDKTKLDEKTQRLLSREISSMEKLHHSNVIRIFEVLETLSHIYIVMEYAPAGELFHKILNDGKFSESLTRKYFAQILSAVSHMHDYNIIHRDIKAENVFLSSNGTVKLGDLGFSTVISSPDQHLNTFCGSPPYAAPELFKDDYYLGRFVDIWALGVLLYFMVTGAMPFRADTVGKLKRKILDGTFHVPEHVTENCRFLICQILRPLPTDRFTVQEIMRSLWLEGVCFTEASKSHKSRPCLDCKELSDEEQLGMQQLAEYGITNEMIEKCPEDSRNNINGTFRIAVYQAERRAIERRLEREAKIQEEVEAMRLSRSKNKKNSPTKGAETPQSKFCNIL